MEKEMKIGKQLQLCREALKPKVSQAQAARDLGIERGTLSNLENDERLPSLEMLLRLAEYYKTTTDYILGREKKSLPKGGSEIVEYFEAMSDRGRNELMLIAETLFEADQRWQQYGMVMSALGALPGGFDILEGISDEDSMSLRGIVFDGVTLTFDPGSKTIRIVPLDSPPQSLESTN